MAQCPNCGVQAAEGAGFCPACGTSLTAAAVTSHWASSSGQASPPDPGQPPSPGQPPYAGQQPSKKKGGCLKWGLIAVGIVVLLAIIGAALGGGDKETPSAATLASVPVDTAAPAVAEGSTPTTEAQTITTTEAPTTTPTPAGELGTRENPLPIGQEAQVGNWKVKVVGATLDGTNAVLDANQFNDKPQAGYQYVLVKIEATYTGEESATFWMDTTYKFVGNGGNTFDSGMVVAPEPITDAGEVFPGASVSGNLLFAVATDQVTGGSMMLEQSFSFDENRAFFAVE